MFNDKKNDKKRAIAEYEAALDDLERVSKRDREETDAYLAANNRVAEAEQHVSWWRR